MQTTKRKRTGLTVDNVFQREKYVNIMNLLNLADSAKKPMRFSHLEERLVRSSKNYGKERFFTDGHAHEISKYSKRSELFPENIFDSKYGLRRALNRLKKLGLITSYKPENKKHTYYCLKLTEEGDRRRLKYIIIGSINEIHNMDILYDLHVDVVKAYLEDNEKKK